MPKGQVMWEKKKTTQKTQNQQNKQDKKKGE